MARPGSGKCEQRVSNRFGPGYSPGLLQGNGALPAAGGEQVVENNLVTFRGLPAFSASFLDRTVAARRHEKPTEGATGIIPGNRGKADRNWCGPPLRGASRRQANITSSSGRRRSRSSYATMELCGQARSRNRVRAESGPGLVSSPVSMQLPRGLWLLLYDQDAAKRTGRSTLPKGLALKRAGRERGATRRGAERVWQSSGNSSLGRSRKTRSPNCKSKAT